jgi:hypothetical protein
MMLAEKVRKYMELEGCEEMAATAVRKKLEKVNSWRESLAHLTSIDIYNRVVMVFSPNVPVLAKTPALHRARSWSSQACPHPQLGFNLYCSLWVKMGVELAGADAVVVEITCGVTTVHYKTCPNLKGMGFWRVRGDVPYSFIPLAHTYAGSVTLAIHHVFLSSTNLLRRTSESQT